MAEVAVWLKFKVSEDEYRLLVKKATAESDTLTRGWWTKWLRSRIVIKKP